MIINRKDIPEDAINILAKLNDVSEGYLVGGCVRDLLLGKRPHDFDITTKLRPNEIIELLRKNGYYCYGKGIEYGTVVAVGKYNEEFEITTYRSDSNYSDGRHPDTVEFADNILEDLSRRDFTINAIAYNPISKEIIDRFGGINDLNNKRINAVGDANLRFKEDGLRILRALRFAIRFDYEISGSTKTAILRNIDKIDNISKERITNEFRKIFSYNKPVFNTFREYATIIKKIIPEIEPCIGFEQNNPYHHHDVYLHMLSVTDLCNTTDFCINMAALLHDIGKPNTYTQDEEGFGHFHGHPKKSLEITEKVLKNDFRITSKEYDKICKLVELHDMTFLASEKAVKRNINKYGHEFIEDWCVLKKADRNDHMFPKGKDVRWYPQVEEIKKIYDDILLNEPCCTLKDLQINGNDLISLGIPKGKEIGIILNDVLNKVIDDELYNEKETLVSYVENNYIEDIEKNL